MYTREAMLGMVHLGYIHREAMLGMVHPGIYASLVHAGYVHPGIYASLYTLWYTLHIHHPMTVLVSGACSDVRVYGKKPWAQYGD